MSLTREFRQDECAGSWRDFVVACSDVLAASGSCRVVADRWFSPHFSVLSDFHVRRWSAVVSRPRAVQPVWLACWLDTPDRSAASASREVQGILDVYRPSFFWPSGLYWQGCSADPDATAGWQGIWGRVAGSFAGSVEVMSLMSRVLSSL